MSVFSHSRISSFENCPLQYRYRYIDRIKTDVQGIEAFMGKLVHETLEFLYEDQERARRSMAEDYGAVFSDLWRRRYTPDIRIVRERQTAEDYHAIGRRCVEDYFRTYHPFGENVVGTEVKLEFSLDQEGRYRMLGYVDRIDRPSPGVLEIHDYKTGALPRRHALDQDRQLSLYEIALRGRHEGIKEVRHVWHYLAHDERFEQKRTSEQLQRVKLSTIRKIQTIEATVEFPSRISPLCSWCDYRPICPEWSTKSEASSVTGAAETDRPDRTVTSEESGPAPAPPSLEPTSGQYLLF